MHSRRMGRGRITRDDIPGPYVRLVGGKKIIPLAESATMRAEGHTGGVNHYERTHAFPLATGTSDLHLTTSPIPLRSTKALQDLAHW
jgi:hypothetical protein